MTPRNLTLTLGQMSDGERVGYTPDDGNGGLSVIWGSSPLIALPFIAFITATRCQVSSWLSALLAKCDTLEPALVDLSRTRWSEASRRDYQTGKASVKPRLLLDSLVNFVGRFYHAAEQAHYAVLALFIMMTHLFALFEAVPYLHLVGEPATGKTVLGTILEYLCFNGRQAASITPAALYGYLDCTRGTVIIDEQCRGNSTWMNVMLAGYRNGGTVMVCDRGTNLPVNRNTFGPKVLLTNGLLAHTALESRVIQLRAERSTGILERFSPARLSDELGALRDDLHVFGLSMAEEVSKEYWQLSAVSGISHRDTDLAAPLLAIARVIDGPTNTGSHGVYASVVDFLVREAERKKLDYLIDADLPALARAIKEYVEMHKAPDVPSKDPSKPGYYVAEKFTDYVNKERFLERPLATREIGRKLNVGQLVIERRVVDVDTSPPGSVAVVGARRQQRRAYCFDVERARQICGVMP